MNPPSPNLCVVGSCETKRWSGNLCAHHQGQALIALRSILSSADLIRASAGRSSAPQTERVGGSRDAVLPAAALLALDGQVAPGAFGVTFGDHKDDLKDEPPVTFLLDQWARMICEGRCNPPPSTLAALVAFLASQHEWTCAQRYADDYFTEITELAGKVAAKAANGRQVKRGTVPCGACGQRTLIQYEPSTPVIEPDGTIGLSGGEWRCREPACHAIEADEVYEARLEHYDDAITTTREARTA